MPVQKPNSQFSNVLLLAAVRSNPVISDYCASNNLRALCTKTCHFLRMHAQVTSAYVRYTGALSSELRVLRRIQQHLWPPFSHRSLRQRQKEAAADAAWGPRSANGESVGES